ncbi:MAG: hypothetical protein K6C95_10235 [Lachnospiraceae bacterium]|nr:hypothetical protein [Lachnospiraceae bacterium]
MINFDEELKKFHPSLELEQVQEVIQNRNLDDVSDILIELMGNRGQTSAAAKPGGSQRSGRRE